MVAELKIEPPRAVAKEATLDDVVAELNRLLATALYDNRVCILTDSKTKRHVLTYSVRTLSFSA